MFAQQLFPSVALHGADMNRLERSSPDNPALFVSALRIPHSVQFDGRVCGFAHMRKAISGRLRAAGGDLTPAFETIADMAALQMDDKRKLRIAGEALFGSNWQSELAAELSVPDRTLQRWYTGVFEVPEHVWKNIAAISRRRGNTLFKIADGL